ncbi:MAG: helix-turn-helix domain-containing protein [Oscillospiraceae bacterium]
MINVGERLVYLRKLKGITTNKLANIAGVSQSHLREIERGSKNPTVETLSYFCDALGISLADFFGQDDRDINPLLASAVKKLTDSQQIKLAEFLNETAEER